MADRKTNVCFVGDHHAGKSTIAGHLMSQRGAADKSLIEKYEKEASDMGKGSMKYAWVTDKLKSERQTGMSQECSLSKFTGCQFNDVTIIDAPGHGKFVKNTISGIAQADCVVLVVSAAPGEMEAGMADSGQTKEHVRLASTLGIKKIIVVVNKMDSTSPPYSQERFKEVGLKVAAVVKGCGYSPKQTAFVPVSGWTGENLSEKSGKMSWFKGWNVETKEGKSSGDSLLQALDSVDVPARDEINAKPLRVPISAVYNVKTVGVVPTGVVESGTLKVGDSVIFEPGRVTAEVASIESHHNDVKEATSGDVVGFNIISIANGTVTKGMVCGDPENSPPQPAESFIAKITVLDTAGSIVAGYTPMVDVHTAHVPCKFVELTSKIDKKGVEIEKNPTELKAGESALVKLVPMAPLCVDPNSSHQGMGCFAVRDGNTVVAVGRVKSVVAINPKKKASLKPKAVVTSSLTGFA